MVENFWPLYLENQNLSRLGNGILGHHILGHTLLCDFLQLKIIQFLNNLIKCIFGSLFSFFEQIKFFPKNQGRPLLSIHAPVTLCKVSEKSNESIPRKVIWIHRTLQASKVSNYLCHFPVTKNFDKTWFHPGLMLNMEDCIIDILTT